MENIQKLLANLEKPVINKAFRENSKRRLVSYAKNETANELFIVKILKEILNPLNISLYLKTKVRNRLINLERKKTLWEVFWELFWDFFGKVVELNSIRILASWVIASLFFVNIVWFNTTSADIESRLFAVEWSVYIQHLWSDWKKISSNEILSIWDQIKTSKNSVAEIYFYDNSVSRIAENTRIWIANLTTNVFDIKPTVLKLENWRVWNQILSSEWWFKIETKNSSVNTKEWIFDIQNNWKNTEIQVISKPIEIKTQNWNKFNYSKVYAWIWVKTWENWIIKEKLEENNKDSWTKKNQKEDQKYRKKIVKKIEEIQISKAENKFSDNSKNLKNVQKNLFSETINSLQKIKIYFYNKNSEKISETKEQILSNIEKSDKIFKEEILDFLSKERQKLKIFLPWDNLYEYKLFISDISLKIDTEWKTIWDIKIERLNEAHEILNSWEENNQNNENKLVKILDNFSKFGKKIQENSIKNLKSDFEKKSKKWENKLQIENVLKNKLSSSNDELFLLQSLENSKTSKEIKAKIKSQKEILAKQIKEIAWILTKDTKIKEQISRTNNYIASQNSKRIKNYLSRVDKFKSENWQKNTLHWILEEISNKKENISLLYSLRAKLNWDLSFMVSQKIIQVRRSVK